MKPAKRLLPYRLLALILAILSIILFQRNRSLAHDLASTSDQLTVAQFDSQIRKLQFSLACTPDQIIGDSADWSAIDETRLHAYQSANFPPSESYWDVLSFVIWENPPKLLPKETKPDAGSSISQHDIAIGMLNHYGADLAWGMSLGEACGNIAVDFDSLNPLGDYLRSHPDIFNTRLRPLLMRLMRAKSPQIASHAARALNAASDHSPEFHAALIALVARDFTREFGAIEPCLALDALGDRSPEFRNALVKLITHPYETTDPTGKPTGDQKEAIALLKKCFPAEPLPPLNFTIRKYP